MSDKNDNEQKNLLEPVLIDGIKYYTLEQFALKTGKSVSSIRYVMKYVKGKKLKHIVLLNKILILASEYTEYRWRLPGCKSIYYYYNEKGEKVLHKHCLL